LADQAPASKVGQQPSNRRWLRLAIVAVLVAAAVLLSKWLVLVLLVVLGLWPLALLAGLVLLVIVSIFKGGWPWLKGWLGKRLGGLWVPALAVLTALLIGGLILMLTDQDVLLLLGDGQFAGALTVAI
jgi:hypothetical protein